MNSSRVIDHFIVMQGEPYHSPFKNLGDYYDEMYSYRDFDPKTMYSSPYQYQEAKDMPQGDPHYHWDSIDSKQYEED